MLLTEASFEPYGISHGVAVAVVFLIGFFLFRHVCKSPQRKHLRLRWALAILLSYSALSGIVNGVLRSENGDFSRLHETGYPLFLCDIVAIVLAVALVRKSQRLTEVGYAWALAGTVQGLVTPVLEFDWPSLEYLFFFVQHGLGPISALLLVWGFSLKPEPGAYKRIWIWTWVYLFGSIAINSLLGTNYGFVNAKPPMPTALDYFGDYPWYLLTLHGVAAVVFYLLLLPFKIKRQ